MKEQTVNGNLAKGLEVLEGCDKEPELCIGSLHQSGCLFTCITNCKSGSKMERESEMLDSTWGEWPCYIACFGGRRAHASDQVWLSPRQAMFRQLWQTAVEEGQVCVGFSALVWNPTPPVGNALNKLRTAREKHQDPAIVLLPPTLHPFYTFTAGVLSCTRAGTLALYPPGEKLFSISKAQISAWSYIQPLPSQHIQRFPPFLLSVWPVSAWLIPLLWNKISSHVLC